MHRPVAGALDGAGLAAIAGEGVAAVPVAGVAGAAAALSANHSFMPLWPLHAPFLVAPVYEVPSLHRPVAAPAAAGAAVSAKALVESKQIKLVNKRGFIFIVEFLCKYSKA